MDVKDVLFMSRGDGENSYCRTSTYTQTVALMTRPVIARTVSSLLADGFLSHKLLNMVDLGCSSGPSVFTFMSTVVETMEKVCREPNHALPELQFYLNDLFGNDFNTLFKGLLKFYEGHGGLVPSCFVMGAPGSFHGRLFPSDSLHLAHSSYSVHWLSQVPQLTSDEGLPLNKGKIYISKTSHPAVAEAYLAQFDRDLSAFLKCRGEEMVSKGRLVLMIQGRQTADPASKESCYMWELLAEAIASMVLEGIVTEEKLDSLNVPYYTASVEEVSSIVEREGSFEIEHVQTLAINRGGTPSDDDPWSKGRMIAKHARSWTGSIISHHFGEEIMDELYNERLSRILGDDLAKEQSKGITIVLVLKRHA